MLATAITVGARKLPGPYENKDSGREREIIKVVFLSLSGHPNKWGSLCELSLFSYTSITESTEVMFSHLGYIVFYWQDVVSLLQYNLHIYNSTGCFIIIDSFNILYQYICGDRMSCKCRTILLKIGQ